MKNLKKLSLLALVGVVLALIIPDVVMASTTGAEFQGIYDTITNWSNGYLGKTISIFAFIIGLGLGVARSNPLPAISGIVFALFVSYGPGLLDGIVTAIV
jgi:conjugal transfer pilus assembly protein TraA